MTGTIGNLRAPAPAPVEQPGGGWVLLFDGQCRLCRRSVAILRRLDWLHRLRLVSFRELDLARFNAMYGSAITPADADREMYLVRRAGPSLGGFDAYRRMACLLPPLWPLVPLLWLPGVSRAGRRVYRWVAARRTSFFGRCDDTCRLDP